jgi:hypothetical protein
MAPHYDTAILPARPRRPRDKAKSLPGEDFLPIFHLIFSNLKSWLRGLPSRRQPATSSSLSQRVHLPV